jgi:hypothetical protein
MADGPDQRVYIAVEGPPASGIGVILVFDPATESMDVYADFPGTMPASSADGLVRPFDVAFGPDGHLYVTNRGALGAGGKPGMNLLRFEGPLSGNPGAPLPTVGNTGALYAILSGQPTSLTFGPDRNGDGESDLYVSHNGAADRLAVISGPLGPSAGAALGPFLVTGVDTPVGLEFRDGELFLAAFGQPEPNGPADELRVYDASGNLARVFAPTGAEPPDPANGLLLTDPTEFLFILDPHSVPALGRGPFAILLGIVAVLGMLSLRSRRSEA